MTQSGSALITEKGKGLGSQTTVSSEVTTLVDDSTFTDRTLCPLATQAFGKVVSLLSKMPPKDTLRLLGNKNKHCSAYEAPLLLRFWRRIRAVDERTASSRVCVVAAITVVSAKVVSIHISNSQKENSLRILPNC